MLYCPKCNSNKLIFNRQEQKVRWLKYKIKNNGLISQKYNSIENGWNSNDLIESFECEDCGWIKYVEEMNKEDKNDNVFLEAVGLFYK